MKKSQFIILLLVVLLAVSGIFMIYNNVQPSSLSVPIVNNKVIHISSKPNLSSTVYGQVHAQKTSNVSMEISGKIDSYNKPLHSGVTFQKNDILISVERIEILYQLLKARTQLKRLILSSVNELEETSTDIAKRWGDYGKNIQRTQRLANLPTIQSSKEEELITMLGIYEVFNNVKQLELKAMKYYYSAPFDGVIIQSTIYPGKTIKKNTQLMQIADNSSIYVVASLPISVAYKIDSSAVFYFIDKEADTIGSGNLVEIGSPSDSLSGVNVYFSIENGADYIHQIVNITSKLFERQEETYLPISAIHNDSVALVTKQNIIKIPIQPIQLKGDSVQLKGLPRACDVLLNYPVN